ncbi:hypothetical protein ASPSYDRAFT_338367 [Aspergillus sydowii CBS 593.65]|uniref:Uncharacterized protein n=1 Tax=Aspergillus sydowii CBS 593.65 TaxID=1036612 RepID=A0A1L9TZ20_9EURO|nr:uncharacterized protein ASPSYDRAFT_338367 [Aspergillus sydowii CBS 593.65]OJJ64659.1 hypothetical protein ASPSYDRAFT_338367 [Aspergillus sydowii CBS 593.65]
MANRDSKWTHLVSNGKVVLDAVPEIDLVCLLRLPFPSLCALQSVNPLLEHPPLPSSFSWQQKQTALRWCRLLSVYSGIEFFESPPLFIVSVQRLRRISTMCSDPGVSDVSHGSLAPASLRLYVPLFSFFARCTWILCCVQFLVFNFLFSLSRQLLKPASHLITAVKFPSITAAFLSSFLKVWIEIKSSIKVASMVAILTKI